MSSAPNLADKTWNVTRGCTKVSPGCSHCFAERIAERHRGKIGHPYEQGFDLRLVPETVPKPLTWTQPQRVMVDTMSDLFHPRVPLAFHNLVWETMARASWHLFLILSKRAAEQCSAARLFNRDPLPNVWLGVSLEDRAHGLPRLEELRNTPAAMRFVCIEPLLERLGPLDLTGIDWVIVGGESGPNARLMHVEWVRCIRDQCQAAGVPFFFKNWGRDETLRALDGRLWNEFPEFQHAKPPPYKRRRRLRAGIHRAVDYLYASKLRHCPVCGCCDMEPTLCVYCEGTGEVTGEKFPVEALGPCLQCGGIGTSRSCNGGCTPYDHHEQLNDSDNAGDEPQLFRRGETWHKSLAKFSLN